MRKIIQNHIISYYIDKIRILLIAYYIAANTNEDELIKRIIRLKRFHLSASFEIRKLNAKKNLKLCLFSRRHREKSTISLIYSVNYFC